MEIYNGVKVFSATKFMDRDKLGETVTSWLQANSNCKVVRTEVVQSSDSEFHCLSIVLFFKL
jgi:hypothetical protein